MKSASDSECRQRVAAILRERLLLEVPSFDADLVATGRLDSLGLVELVALLEEEFETTIPFEKMELDAFRSVDSVAVFLTGHLAQAHR